MMKHAAMQICWDRRSELARRTERSSNMSIKLQDAIWFNIVHDMQVEILLDVRNQLFEEDDAYEIR